MALDQFVGWKYPNSPYADKLPRTICGHGCSASSCSPSCSPSCGGSGCASGLHSRSAFGRKQKTKYDRNKKG